MEEESFDTGNELDKSLFELTLEELKELAKNKNISMPGAFRKPDMVFYIQEAGGASEEDIKLAKQNIANKSVPEKPVSQKATPKKSSVKFEHPVNKTAIYSERNLFSSTYGRIEKGYNIVSNDAAQYFIQQKSVREASPQEVAEFYGVK